MFIVGDLGEIPQPDSERIDCKSGAAA